MYVSMNPNGETGKVIHISQDDTNREVEFIPYYQNGLVKTTSDETVAHINSIKGNTVSFNQLVENGNFADTSGWNAADCTFTVSNNIATVVSSTTSGLIYRDDYSIPSGHKILIKLTSNSPNPFFTRIYNPSWSQLFNGLFTKNGNSQYLFYTATDKVKIIYMSPNHAGTSTIQNVQIFDLTLMGIDSLTTTAEVEAWLSSHIGVLPYYDYTQGTLIPFKGTGLKTVGFNQWDEEWENGYYSIVSGNKASNSNYFRCKNLIRVLPNTQYYFKTNVNDGGIIFYDGSGAYISGAYYASYPTKIFTTPSNCYLLGFYQSGATYNSDVCINISNISKNGTYEPYTSNTLSLSTLTHFPTGMKSAGSVYDELTSSKAITRIGSRAYQSGDESDPTVITDGTTTYYPLPTPTSTDISLDLTYPVWNGGTEQILPINDSTPDTAPIKANITYPDRTEDTEFLYKQTSFVFIPRTWAFVCKNITQALSLVGNVLKGTIPSGMTSESGKFPLKLKMTDEDGDVFSEKIDLFVERKP